MSHEFFNLLFILVTLVVGALALLMLWRDDEW
jgi:hypothetical protein